MYDSTSASEEPDINHDNFSHSKPPFLKWEDKFLFLRNKWLSKCNKRSDMNYSDVEVEKYESTYKNLYEYEHPKLQEMQHSYTFQQIHRSNKQPNRNSIPYKDFKYCKQNSSCPYECYTKTGEIKNHNTRGNSSNRKYSNYSESSSDESITTRRKKYKNYKQLHRNLSDENVHKNRNNHNKNICRSRLNTQRKNSDIHKMHTGRSSAGFSGFDSETRLTDSIALQHIRDEEDEAEEELKESYMKKSTGGAPKTGGGYSLDSASNKRRRSSRQGASMEREYSIYDDQNEDAPYERYSIYDDFNEISDGVHIEREDSILYTKEGLPYKLEFLDDTPFERDGSIYYTKEGLPYKRGYSDGAPFERDGSIYYTKEGLPYKRGYSDGAPFERDGSIYYTKEGLPYKRGYSDGAPFERDDSIYYTKEGLPYKRKYSMNPNERRNTNEDNSFITFEQICSCLEKLNKKCQESVHKKTDSNNNETNFKTPCSEPQCMKRGCPSDCLESYISFEDGYIEQTTRYVEKEENRPRKISDNHAQINSKNSRFESIQKSRNLSHSPVLKNCHKQNNSSEYTVTRACNDSNRPKSIHVSYPQCPVNKNGHKPNYSSEYFVTSASNDSDNRQKTINVRHLQCPVHKNRRQRNNSEYNVTNPNNDYKNNVLNHSLISEHNNETYKQNNSEYIVSSASNDSITYIPIEVSTSELRKVKYFQSKNSIKCIRGDNTDSNSLPKTNYESRQPSSREKKKICICKRKRSCCCCNREVKQKKCIPKKCVFIEDSETSCCCTKPEKPRRECCCCKCKQRKRKICTRCHCKDSVTSITSSQECKYIKCPYAEKKKKCKCISSHESCCTRCSRNRKRQTCSCSNSDSESYSEDSLSDDDADSEPVSCYCQVDRKKSCTNMGCQIKPQKSTTEFICDYLKESLSNLSNKICRPLKNQECPAQTYRIYCEEKVRRIPSKAKEILKRFKDLITPPKPNSITKPFCVPASKPISQVQINSLSPKDTIGSTVMAQDLISYLSDDAPKDCSCTDRCCSKLNCPYWKDNDPPTHDKISFPRSNETCNNKNEPIFTICKTCANTKPKKSKLKCNIEPIIEEENEGEDSNCCKDGIQTLNTPKICQIKSSPKSRISCCKSVHFCSSNLVQCIPSDKFVKPSCVDLNIEKEICEPKTCGPSSSIFQQWKEFLCPRKSALTITPRRRWLKEMIESIPPKMYEDVPDIQFKFVPPLCKKKYHVVKMKRMCSL